MNFDGYFSNIYEDDEFQNGRGWISEMPEKYRTIAAPVEPNNMICHINRGNSSGWPLEEETINEIAGSYTNCIVDDVPSMSPIGYTDLLTEGFLESERSICMTDEVSAPSLYSHVYDRCHFPSSLDSLLGNGDLCSNEFPAPAIPSYNKTTYTESYVASSLTNSPKFDVSKTDQMKRSENKKLQEVLSLIFEDPIQDEAYVSSLKIQDVEKQCNALLYSCIHPPSVAVSSFAVENQDFDKVCDMNATPLKKPPKRRKHRPKVMIEGKPQKSSKPEAKKVENSKEKRVGKRKYVRKSVHNGNVKIAESKKRPCRRAIHFSAENPIDGSIIKVADQSEHFKELSAPLFKLTSSIQVDEEQAEPIFTGWTCDCCSTLNSGPRRNLDVQISHHGGSSITENGETYSGIFRSSQMPISEVIKLNSKHSTRRDHHNQQTDIARDTRSGYLGTSNVKNIGNFDFIGQVVDRAQNIPRNNYNSIAPLLKSSPKSVEKAGTHKKDCKRDHASIVEEQVYIQTDTGSSSLCKIRNDGSYISDPGTNGEKKQMVVNDDMGSSITYFSSAENHYDDGGRQSTIDNGFLSQANTIKLSHSSESNHFQNKCSNDINESIRNWLLKSASSDFYMREGQPLYSDPNPCMRKKETKMYNIFSLFPDIVMAGEKIHPLPSMDETRSPTHRVTSRVDTSHRNVLAKMRTMEEALQSKEMVQHSANCSGNSLMKMPGDVAAFGLFPNNINSDSGVLHNDLSHKWKQMDQIEEIEYKFRFLTIHDKSGGALVCLQNDIVPYKVGGKIVSYKVGGKIVPYQVGGKIVPYKVGGKIVPYGGMYQIKKRKPRPKVDLDPETDRLWKLLMGKSADEGADGDKERYWEEERKVFHGRADSFIARMHLVQGDRRFSQWKGSVVDSVIGVFLTQNVSDHLSSSAFLSLAAQFPLNSSKSMAYYKDDSDLPLEPEIFDLGEPLCNYSGITDSVSQNDQSEFTALGVRWYFSPPEQTAEKIILSHYSLDTLSAKAIEAARSSSGSNSGVSNSEADDSATAHKSNPIPDSLDHLYPNVTEYSDCETNKPPFYYRTLHTNILEETENWHENKEKFLPERASPPTSSTHIHSPSSLDKYTLNLIPNAEVHHVEENLTSWPSVIPRTVTKYGTIEGSPIDCGQEIRLKQSLSDGTLRLEEYSLSSSVYQPTRSENSNTCTWNNKHQHTTEQLHNFEGYTEKDDNPFHEFMYPSSTIGEAKDEICGSSSLVADNKNNNTVTKFENITEKKINERAYSSEKMVVRKGKTEKYGNSICDWEQFRKEVQSSCGKRGRNMNTMDSLDYEAIRNAGVDVVSAAIRERGMNNMLAERIKGFLDRIVADHGDIDLEWLRDAPPDKAKDYLLSIRGLGLKSVECVRLLTLHHLAFPVDTNVGRIAVRLGWVPLQPLPESLQLHLLELYPVLESIQKYLWPRLCKLDQRTLYELHYQMITFGKVFCTKSRPNCNACPMRGECRHFASAFARYELPDSHPLLLEMDRREPDDPSPYLLAIWTPGETADSIQGSEVSCEHSESCSTCTEEMCFSCSSIREENSRTVRGTLLIPCRTATRGSFPLNGTYFQVNEMFADHDSSLNPIVVPRTWIWNLPRRTVYFGTSVSTIFKGLSTEGIQYCFWRGFVCVRGFDKTTRAPRPLMARLHFPASKLQKTKTVKK